MSQTKDKRVSLIKEPKQPKQKEPKEDKEAKIRTRVTKTIDATALPEPKKRIPKTMTQIAGLPSDNDVTKLINAVLQTVQPKKERKKRVISEEQKAVLRERLVGARAKREQNKILRPE